MSGAALFSSLFLGTQMRPSLRSDSLIKVSLDCWSPDAGIAVGWIWLKHGFANAAPRLYARHVAVTLQPRALVER